MLKCERKWKGLLTQIKEFLGYQRGMRFSGPGKTESRMDIFEGNYVPPAALDKSFNSVQGNQMSWVESLEILRFSQYFLAIHLLDFAKMRNFLRKDPQSAQISNKIGNRSGLGAFKTAGGTKFLQEGVYLFRTEVGDAPPLNA